jgi:hypothetical protein
MRTAAFISFMLLAGALLFAARAPGVQNPASPQPNSGSAASGLEDLEQRLGPFSIVGQSLTVVLHIKRLRAASNPAFRQTLAALEIRDRSGAVLYQKTFPYEVERGNFRQAVTAAARLLPGGSFAALLIRYLAAPAAPGSAVSWQLFQFRSGKLVRFDKPVSRNPGPGPFRGAVAMGAGGAMPVGFGVQGDLVELRVWTGNFHVFVPLRVDWAHGQLMPGEQCFEMEAGSLRETGCDLRVEAYRKPAETDPSFVRMFHNSTENEGNARHLVLTKDSKIDFLGAKAIVTWNAEGDAMKIALSDLWLKVLIDDNDENLGWIHSDEDFSAVGLPSGSPAP